MVVIHTNYEDIHIGDWVGVLLETGDIDLEAYGEVVGKYEKSKYDYMKVIQVKLHRKRRSDWDVMCYAPKELVKLSGQMKRHLINGDITDRVRNYRTFSKVF